MKLLYIPLPTIDSQADDLCNAFRKKCRIHIYRGIDQAISFNADLVYMHAGAIAYTDFKIIRENTRSIWTQWTGDIRPEQLEPVMRCPCDLTFMAGVQDIYPFKIHWLPHAVADWQFRPVNEQATGVVYIANEYHHFPGGLERYELAKSIENLTWYGSATVQIDWRQTPDIYNAHGFSIGCNIYNNIKYYFSNRPLWSMAAGCCHVMRWVPGIDELFSDNECIIYKDNSEVKKLIEKNKDKRNEIALAGQQKVREKYTYDNIVKMYLDECTNFG